MINVTAVLKTFIWWIFKFDDKELGKNKIENETKNSMKNDNVSRLNDEKLVINWSKEEKRNSSSVQNSFRTLKHV